MDFERPNAFNLCDVRAVLLGFDVIHSVFYTLVTGHKIELLHFLFK